LPSYSPPPGKHATPEPIGTLAKGLPSTPFLGRWFGVLSPLQQKTLKGLVLGLYPFGIPATHRLYTGGPEALRPSITAGLPFH